MTSFSKALKALSVTKDDMSELQALCGWEDKEEFSDADMELLTDIVQRKNEGAESYTVAYGQMQAEVVPVETEPVVEKKPDGTDTILDRAENIADQDGNRVLQTLDGYGEDLQTAVLSVYMNRLNHVFETARVQQAVVEEPNELAKKSGPFTSRLRERLAAQAPPAALPASTNSSTETSPTE